MLNCSAHKKNAKSEREIEYGYFSVTERTKKLDAIGANHLRKMIRGYEQWVLKPLFVKP
jgi:hypothetical protein